MMKKVTIALAGLLALTQGHSWTACTKYTKEILGQDYDGTSCEGYIRDWNSYVQYSDGDVFGADHGANYQPGTSGQWCSKTIGSSASNYSTSYTTTYPMASYKPGDTIRLVWPAKNHANYECYSNIPDKQMKLFVNNITNPTSDPTIISGWDLVIDWHAENGGNIGDGIPFQNCPSFCDNTDKAVCYGDFVVPTKLTTGFYTFMWYWAFNTDADVYTSCWEAYVSSSAVPSGIDNITNSDATTSSPDPSSQYIVQIPICYTGAAYNEDTIETSATSYFGIDVSSNNPSEGASSFNCTLVVLTTTSNLATITTKAESLCPTLVTGFGTGSCTVCDDIVVFSTSNGGTAPTPQPTTVNSPTPQPTTVNSPTPQPVSVVTSTNGTISSSAYQMKTISVIYVLTLILMVIIF